VEDGKEVKILNGGKGGLGNEYFKNATNRSPEIKQMEKLGKKPILKSLRLKTAMRPAH